MTFRRDEVALTAAAEAAHPDETVLAAGVFSWQHLLGAEMAGSGIGAMAGGMVSDTIGAAAGAVVGGHLAVDAAAEANGMTVALLVAVTDGHIYVHNVDAEAAGPLVADYPRASTTVTIRKFGLSRVVHLANTATGDSLALHGSVSPLSAQTRPDKVVMALLSEHPADS